MSEKYPALPVRVVEEAWHEHQYPRPSDTPHSPAFERAMAVINAWAAGEQR
jgi:hypothetical protein